MQLSTIWQINLRTSYRMAQHNKEYSAIVWNTLDSHCELIHQPLDLAFYGLKSLMVGGRRASVDPGLMGIPQNLHERNIFFAWLILPLRATAQTR